MTTQQHATRTTRARAEAWAERDTKRAAVEARNGKGWLCRSCLTPCTSATSYTSERDGHVVHARCR